MSFSKRKTAYIIAFIIAFSVICAILFSAPPRAAEGEIIEIRGGYVVTSAYGKNISGEEVEGRQLDHSEITTQMIIISLIEDRVPLFEDFMTIFVSTFCSGLFCYVGIKLVNKRNVLKNKNRDRIYKKIEEKPGINFTELVKELGITKAMAKYHLDRLKYYGLITPYSNNGRSGYFRNNGIYSESEMKLYLIKKNLNDSIILEIVDNNPGITRKEIAGRIELSGPSITWHMERLEKSGLIEVVKDGRLTRYYINSDQDLIPQKAEKARVPE